MSVCACVRERERESVCKCVLYGREFVRINMILRKHDSDCSNDRLPAPNFSITPSTYVIFIFQLFTTIYRGSATPYEEPVSRQDREKERERTPVLTTEALECTFKKLFSFH